MAKSTGLIKLEGFLGGYTFYYRKGKPFVKSSSGHTKERMKTDPDFANVRKVNNEFGGASKASKVVRDGLGKDLSLIAGKCNNQVTGLFQKVIANTEGDRGRRPVKFAAKKNLLQGFQFGKKAKVDIRIDKTVSATDKGIEISWKAEKYHRSNLPAKSKATHVRMVIAAICVSDLVFNEKTEQYEPKNRLWHGKSKVSYSDYLPLDEEIGDKRYSLIIENSGQRNEGDAIVICAGVIFYEEDRGHYYTVHTGSFAGIEDVIDVGDHDEKKEEFQTEDIRLTTKLGLDIIPLEGVNLRLDGKGDFG